MVPVERITSSAPSVLRSLNPSTLETLAELDITTKEAIVEAVQRSRQAFQSWRLTPLKYRLKKIAHFHRLLVDRQDEIAKLITQEVGKPIVESYLAELAGPLETCQWLQKKQAKF